MALDWPPPEEGIGVPPRSPPPPPPADAVQQEGPVKDPMYLPLLHTPLSGPGGGGGAAPFSFKTRKQRGSTSCNTDLSGSTPPAFSTNPFKRNNGATGLGSGSGTTAAGASFPPLLPSLGSPEHDAAQAPERMATGQPVAGMLPMPSSVDATPKAAAAQAPESFLSGTLGQFASATQPMARGGKPIVLPAVDILDVESNEGVSTPLGTTFTAPAPQKGVFSRMSDTAPELCVPLKVHDNGNLHGNPLVAHASEAPSTANMNESFLNSTFGRRALPSKKKKALQGLRGLQRRDSAELRASLERAGTGLTDRTETGVDASHVFRSNVLREFDIRKLEQAFSKLDVQGDGGLELFEFRVMWRAVFAQRPMDQDAWKATQVMFQDIDTDTSGVITFEEIIFYLEKNRREELLRIRRPSSLIEWVWQFVGNNVGRGWTRVKGDNCVKMAIYTWKIIAQILVFVQCAVIFIESEPSMQRENDYPGTDTLYMIDIVCNAFFSVEYIAWIISHPIMVRHDDPMLQHMSEDDMQDLCLDHDEVRVFKVFHKGRFQVLEIGQFYTEFIALSSFYLRVAIGADAIGARPFAIIRMFRVMRLLRALRVISKKFSARRRGHDGVKRAPELGQALKKSFISLGFLFALVMVAVTVSSALVYYAEQHEAHFNFTTEEWVRDDDSSYDDHGLPTHYQSIPDAMWWAIVTLTTVGYGDKYPSTVPGKFVAAAIMLAGLIVVSFPITILTSTFQQMEQERMDEEHRLLHCREFYEGIKRWLDAGGEVKVDRSRTMPYGSPTNKPATFNMSTFDPNATTSGPDGLTSSRMLLPQGSQPNIEYLLKTSFEGLESRLNTQLSRIVRRLDTLEANVDKLSCLR